MFLYNPERLSLGSNVNIHPMCYIQPGDSVIEIGNDVSIAHGTTSIAESHAHDDIEVSIKYQPMKAEPISIENNVWIGAKVTVLMGITLKSGCIYSMR